MAHDFTETELAEAFEYLDELRDSGRCNMWGAGSFVQRDLSWDQEDANEITGLWMKTFARDLTIAERVARATPPAEPRKGEK